MIASTPCPQQQNVIDCGIFAVSVCIHILEGIPINELTFQQNHIMEFRQTLPSLLQQKKKSVFWHTVLNISPLLNTNHTELKHNPHLLCDEDLDAKIHGDPFVTVRRGHPSMDPKLLLPEDSSHTKSELDFNAQEGSHESHNNDQNGGNAIAQFTETLGDHNHRIVFLRIMLNYMHEDGFQITG